MKFRFEDRHLIISDYTESEKVKISKVLTWVDSSFTEQDIQNLKRLESSSNLSEKEESFLQHLRTKLKASLNCLVKERNGELKTFHFLSNKLKEMFPNIEFLNDINLPIGEVVSVEKDILNGIELFDFQISAVEKCLYRKFGNVVIPTGGGKSYCILALLEKLDQLGKLNKALIIVPTVAIGEQFIEYAIDTGFNKKDIKKLSGGFKDFDARILVAVVNTVSEGIKDKNKDILNLLEETNVLLMDECIFPNQKIVTNIGNITIVNLWNRYKSKLNLPMVQSFNEKTKKFEYKKITKVFRNTFKPLLKVKINRHTFVCTENHKILTPTGWKESKFLKTNDAVIGSTLNCKQIKSIEKLTKKESLKYFQQRGYLPYTYDLEVEDNHNYVVSTNNRKNYKTGIVVHNCHHMQADSWYSICRYKEFEYQLGFSGSLFHNTTNVLKNYHDAFLYGYFGDPIFKVSSQYIRSIGLISQPYVYMESISGMALKYRGRYNHIYDKFIVDNPNRNDVIIGYIKRFLELGLATIIMVQRKNHGVNLLKKIDREDCICIYGGSNGFTLDNGEIVPISIDYDIFRRQFNTGIYKVAIISQVGDEGLNLPSANALILAGGGKSRIKVLQRLGRILRKKERVLNHSYIVDFLDNAHVYLRAQSYKRLNIYKEEGAIIVPDKYQFMNMIYKDFKDDNN